MIFCSEEFEKKLENDKRHILFPEEMHIYYIPPYYDINWKRRLKYLAPVILLNIISLYMLWLGGVSTIITYVAYITIAITTPMLLFIIPGVFFYRTSKLDSNSRG